MTVNVYFRGDDFLRWGAGEPSDLSADQINTSFWNVKVAVEALQAALPEAAVGIADFTVTGTQLTFLLTDGSTIGPQTLPSPTWVSRGDWAASTAYAVNDVVTVGAIAYIVPFAHTSASTFDAGANDGMGHNYYSVFLDFSSKVVPQVDRITDNAKTMTRDDISKYWQCDAAGDVNTEIVITLNANVFQKSDEMHFRQVQTGIVRIAAGAGVTPDGMAGHTYRSSGAGAVLTVKWVSPTEFNLFGSLELA